MMLAALTSLLLYAGGLLLNDYCDRKEDARDRPHRPLPSGRVNARVVLVVAIALLSGGVLLARLASDNGWIVAGLLVTAIVAYDAGVKRVPALGPLLIGSCRGLSLILGAMFATRPTPLPMSVIPFLPFPAGWPEGFLVWFSAGALALYMTAISFIARNETHRREIGLERFAPLLFSTAWLAGLLLLLTTPAHAPLAPVAHRVDPALLGWFYHSFKSRIVLLGLLVSPLAFLVALVGIIRSARLLAGRPEPKAVQKAIGGWILSLIPLQACMIALAAPAGTAIAAVLLLVFYPLSLYTARRFYAS